MFERSLRNAARSTLGGTLLTLLLACNASGSQELGATAGATQLVGSASRLSAAEWTAYTADGQYVRNLAPTSKAVQLNFADPRQYNFAMSRLKLAGKTAANSPHLFELIEAHRQAQLAQGLRAGAVVRADDVASEDAQPDHYIEVANLLDSTVTGKAGSTIPGGSQRTIVDVSISTVAGLQIASNVKDTVESPDPDSVNGGNLTVSTSGDLTISNLTRYTYESLKLETDLDGVFTSSYVHQEQGSLVPQVSAPVPRLGNLVVTLPIDSGGPSGAPDGTIRVCVDRTSKDCDYTVISGGLGTMGHRVRLPLQGSIKVTTPHVFDGAQIEVLKATLNSGRSSPDEGLLRLVLTNTGGDCTPFSTLGSPMAAFWNHTKVSDDGKTFSWNLTGDDVAAFGQGCTLVEKQVKLTLRVPLPVRSVPDGTPFSASFTISNDPLTLRPDYTLLPLEILNGCLAAGTQIQLGNGGTAAIESLGIGQRVFNPYAAGDHALTIEDITTGSEPKPMVRIRDAAGHALLVTESHPIATVDRGMVAASALRAGDVVLTADGPRPLVEVSREAYQGKVYNLRVGSEQQKASLGEDQTVVYANGFVVGDTQIQRKYDARAARRAVAARAAQRPEAGRLDYLQSPLGH